MKAITLTLAAIAAAGISTAAAAKSKFPDSVAALYSAEANYLDNTDRQVLSATRIQEALELQLMSEGVEQDTAKARSAESQLRWGMHYLPAAIYQQLVDRPNGHKVDDQTWLDLATLQYRRGYWGLTGTVEYSLSRIKKRPKRAIRGERTMLRSQLYLKQGRYAQAERTLSRYRGAFEDEPFAEYNRGVALLKQNDSQQGAALLDKVGNMRTDDDTLLALRDLANYTLGNWFLNQEKAGTAIPILKKVRVEGPYSNKALLALGWAYLSDTGSLQRVDEIFSPRCLKNVVAKSGTVINNNSNECRPGRTLRIENLGKKEQNRMQRAMTAWQIVQERSPLFPGVQETLMALPYSLDQLGYTHVAEAQYKKAIKSLQYEASRINDALDVIHAGQLVKSNFPSYEPTSRDQDWDLSTLNLSPKLDTRLLYRLYSEHEFYEALVNYRQLRQLQSHIGERVKALEALVAKAQPAKRSLSNLGSLKLNETETNNSAEANSSEVEAMRSRLLGSLNNRGLTTSLSNTENKSSGKKSKLAVWMTHEKTAESSLSARARELLPKARTLYKQLGNLAAKHAGYLSLQSEMELKIQLDRVNTYMAQARLSLGRIKDRQADQRIEGVEAATPREFEEIDFNPLFKVEQED
ncbi:MAG: tetratricopeptide repeat protein [Gammaproteobacteria bacterium]|nr:tetratricopeptide repeat protein [Gammaproteobacteria bacterium]